MQNLGGFPCLEFLLSHTYANSKQVITKRKEQFCELPQVNEKVERASAISKNNC